MVQDRRSDLLPVALEAAEALHAACTGDLFRAKQAYDEVVRMGDMSYFLAVVAWAGCIAPDQSGDPVVTNVDGPAGEYRERMERAAALVAGVLNRDHEGVLAFWGSLSKQEHLQLGADVFCLACAIALKFTGGS